MKLSALLQLKPKMVFYFLLCGFIPLLISALIWSEQSGRALIDKSFEQMMAIQNIRTLQVENSINGSLTHLRILSESETTRNLFEAVNETDDLFDINREAGAGSREEEAYLNSAHAYLKDFTETYKYKNFYILNSDTGDVLYSVNDNGLLGANLGTGRFRTSSLASLWRKVHNKGTAVIEDFTNFEPDSSGMFAFLGMPLFSEEGKQSGIVVLQLGTEFISGILDSRNGMGETGESYLLRWFRGQNTFSIRSRIDSMNLNIGYELDENLDYWNDAVKNRISGGHGIYVDSIGNPVLVSYSSIEIDNLDWFLISKINREEVLKPLRDMRNNIVLAAILLFLLIIVAAIFIAGNISRPIQSSKEFAWDISHGSFDGRLAFEKRIDELGDLGESLNSMADKLRGLDWQKKGKEGLDDVLRGEWSLKEFNYRFINFLTNHLDSCMGAVYVREDDTDVLVMSASFAMTDREGNFNRISFGDGIIGQAALEKEAVYFSNLHKDAPSFNYGVSERIPPYFLAAPLRFKDQVLGVYFLASFEPYSEAQREFIAINSDNVAVLINSAKIRSTINELLQASQIQQEELRVSNEELEAQTLALRESEGELQAQQEELRVTNEELEERTKALQEKTRSVSINNAELVKAQHEIEQKARDLETASKYKSEFLANMSHELRTPLNSILILSQLFAANKDGNLSERQIESSRAIYSSGSDLLKLINEILDLSKVEAGKVELHMESMSFDSLCRDIKRIYEGMAAEKEITFDIDLADNLPGDVTTDSHRLQQILRNLITNAIKFTERGGRVSLYIGPENDNMLAFRVTDTGIGIPADKQSAVFEAFQQADGKTNRKYGGTGLGLSISRELTKLLGGSISLKSEEGRGSTFSVLLPLVLPGKEPAPVEVIPVQDSAPAPQPEMPSAEMEVMDDRHNLNPGDKTLLIIEDDARFVQVLRDLAQEKGFKCLVAEDGETGLHFADFYKPRAIILDIGLPGIDGWTVMERLKKSSELRHIPVHFMSGSDNSLEALKMGAAGFLTKPVSLEKMSEAFTKIETLISRKLQRLLIVEDDLKQQDSLKQLIGEDDVDITATDSGTGAYDLITGEHFDCIILDLGLKDISGFELLEKIRSNPRLSLIPVIIYTGRDLTQEEEHTLRKYSESIIIKGVKSPERLLEESALFLHRVESDIPEESRKLIKRVHPANEGFNGRKILLVDDDMRNVFALTSVLEEKQMSVVVGKNGLEALARLEEHDDVNLVLMDIMMPVMDGYEAMRKIRSQHKYKNLPVIALTAKAMKGDRHKCIEAGASDYLAKPVNMEKLLSMLRVWLYEA